MKNIYLLLILLLSPLFVAGQAAGDYQSLGGAWNQASSWLRFDGVSFVPAPAPPTTADGIITIVAGTTIDVTTSVDADEILIEGDAILNVQSGGYLRIFDGVGDDLIVTQGDGFFTNDGFCNVLSGATVENRGIISSGNTNFQIDGSFIHNQNGGILPIASWNIGSLLEIQGVTNAKPSGFAGQTFYDFRWNSNQSISISLLGELTDITRNFEIVNTGASTYALILSTTTTGVLNVGGDIIVSNGAALGVIQSGTFTLNVAGNVIINSTKAISLNLLSFNGSGSGVVINVGGDFTKSNTGGVSFVNTAGTANTGTARLNITGNFVQNAGTITMAAGTGGGSLATGTIAVGGNFTVNGGTITETSTPVASSGNVNFTPGTHTFLNTGTITNTINFIVENGATLNLVGESSVAGAGTFTLRAGGTLGVGSVNGLVQGVGSGNIRTANKVFQANGNIIYNGTTQNLGNEWVSPGTLNGVAVNLQINNGAIVTNNNTGSTSLVGILSLTNGRLNIGISNTITIQGVFNSTANGFIGGAVDGSSSLTFSGSGAMGTLNLAPGGESLDVLTVGRTGTLVLGTDLAVNNINLSFGNLNFNNRTLNINGSSIASAGGTGLRSNSTSNLVFEGSSFSGTVPFSGAGNQLNDLVFSTPGGVFNWNSNVTILNRVELTAGTINHTSGLTMGSNATFSRSGGTVTLNSPDVVTRYSVEYTGGVTTGLELPATPTELNNLTINSSGPVLLDKDITINGNVNLLGSTFGANGFDVTLASPSGTWTGNGGGFVGGSGILTVAGNITIVAPSSAPNYTNITVNNGASLTFPTGNLNISADIVNNGTINRSTSTTNFNGNTTISGSSATSLNNVTVSGTLVAPAATTLGIAGNFINTGTFNHNNGTVAFIGTTAISGAQASNFFHVNITGTLTAPSVTQLGIAGDLAHSGTFNHNNGTVALNGTVTAQSISGTAISFNNINVTNPIPPGVSVNSTVRLNGVLTLSAGGHFDADGAGSGVFIVRSTSQTAGGRIAALPTPGNFVGNVTIERYIHGKTGGDYRFLSMPIAASSAPKLSLWRNSIFVTGSFSDRSTNADNSNINNAGNNNASVFTYNSTTQSFVAVTGTSTTSTVLNPLLAYSAYNFNNDPVTASYTGNIVKGPVNISISTTNGNFNLVPNPYPSPIDWDNVTKTNVQNSLYLRTANNVYSTYIGGVAVNPPYIGWAGEIAMGQSFYVPSNGAGNVLALTEATKASTQQHFLREAAPGDYFRIKIQKPSSDHSDEVVVRFLPEATDRFDSDFDALKLNNNKGLFPFSEDYSFNLSTYMTTPEEDYAINSIGMPMAPTYVRMNIVDVVPGKYNLLFSDFNLREEYDIILVDTYLNKETQILDGIEYEFVVTKEDVSAGSNRFYLRINGESIVTGGGEDNGRAMKVYPNPVKDILTIELTEQQQQVLCSISFRNAMGGTILTSIETPSLLSPGTKYVDVSAWVSGVYILTIQCGETTLTTRIIKK